MEQTDGETDRQTDGCIGAMHNGSIVWYIVISYMTYNNTNQNLHRVTEFMLF